MDRSLFSNTTDDIWIAENNDLEIDINDRDWSRFRTLKILMYSKKQTGTRIKIEILGRNRKALCHTMFSADWQGENLMQLWLDNFEPRNQKRDPGCIEGIRFSCEIPGLWPAEISVKEIILSDEAPRWKVNESDTVIDMGYHKITAKADEWKVVESESVIPAAEPFCIFSTEMLSEAAGYEIWTWYKFGYEQGSIPGKLTVERDFDIDVSDQSEILIKMVWDRDTLLSARVMLDDGKERDLLCREELKEDKWRGQWYVFGGSLEGASKLNSVRLTMEEKPDRKFNGRQIGMGMFWILLRQRSELDDQPYNRIKIDLPNDGTITRDIQEVPFDDPPESTTPIGDPVKEGLPFGFIINKENLPLLKEKIKKGEPKKIFTRMLEEADKAADEDIITRTAERAYNGGIGQRKGVRGAGIDRYGPVTAAVHLITGEERYAKAARKWVLRAAASDDWRASAGGCVNRPYAGEYPGRWDSFTGWYPKGFAGEKNHCFHISGSSLGVVLTYDMLYHCFSEEEKRSVEQAFERLGIYMLYDKLHYFRKLYVNMNQGIWFALPLLLQLAFLRDKDPVYKGMYDWTVEFLIDCGKSPWNHEGVFGEGIHYGLTTLSLYIQALGPMAACLGTGLEGVVPDAMKNIMEHIKHCRSTWWEEPQHINISDGHGWVSGRILAFYMHYFKDRESRYLWEESVKGDPPVDLTTLVYLESDLDPKEPELPPAKVYRDQPMAFFRTGWKYGDSLAIMTNIRTVTGHGHRDRGHCILPCPDREEAVRRYTRISHCPCLYGRDRSQS